jgi:hypothetical protein
MNSTDFFSYSIAALKNLKELSGPLLSVILSFLTSLGVVTIRLSKTFRNDHVKEIRRRIEDLESKVSSYWRTPERNIELEDSIKSHFLYLSQDLDQLPKRKCKKQNIASKLLKFRTISMRGRFESSDKTAEPDRIEKVRKAAEDLRGAVIKIM